MNSCLPHVILVNETVFILELADHNLPGNSATCIKTVLICASAVCLTNSWTPAGFLMFSTLS